jgi:hypothetical protein
MAPTKSAYTTIGERQRRKRVKCFNKETMKDLVRLNEFNKVTINNDSSQSSVTSDGAGTEVFGPNEFRFNASEVDISECESFMSDREVLVLARPHNEEVGLNNNSDDESIILINAVEPADAGQNAIKCSADCSYKLEKKLERMD